MTQGAHVTLLAEALHVEVVARLAIGWGWDLVFGEETGPLVLHQLAPQHKLLQQLCSILALCAT
eukprot:CAMPEP_0170257506 /NCGR_PEP_ID=MMETSP0116_2-20130129/28614_1 /TAXON_ID=400756 /ORGANISM="Durinskia baltica, Strain CSIRO CS-38" /LENGTH=63 /DNA_ID=CAMNT_0010508531 /DNA_START=262 /DNA_END=453 /DNA_ORIENTATION=+